MSDLLVQNHGNIFLLFAHTETGRAWIDEHIPADAMTWGRGGVVVEHQYIGDIVQGAQSDGLVVE